MLLGRLVDLKIQLWQNKADCYVMITRLSTVPINYKIKKNLSARNFSSLRVHSTAQTKAES